jgi:hypothetical protein
MRSGSQVPYRCPILPRSRHLPVAVTDGSTIRKINKIGVRLWTDRSFVKTVVEQSDLSLICPQTS